MKVHIRINDNDRSLCGMSPRHGSYDIRTISTFFSRNQMIGAVGVCIIWKSADIQSLS